MKILNWIIVALGVAGLIGIRVVEDRLFYDPFLEYFHQVNKVDGFPDFIWSKLIVHHLFRFLLNLFFSLIIVHFIFKNKDWTIQAGVLILIVFGITFPIYLFCVYQKFEVGYLISFYMRRFVIQPIILLLIIPMFYYRNHFINKEKST